MPNEGEPKFDLSSYNIPDTRAHFVRDVDQVKIINKLGKTTARPNSGVYVHDLREVRLNAQFAEEVDICRRKFSSGKRTSTGFQEEAVCFTHDGYFELKTVRSGEKFLWVSGGSDRLGQALDPDGRHFKLKIDIINNPQHVSGRNIVFNGVGRASNYYHWIGEQMPRLALMKKYIDLSEVDNILVFVKQEVSFIEDSVKTLFPEFKGKIVQVLGHSASSDQAYFFVQQGLAERSKETESHQKKSYPFRASIGSIIDLCELFDSKADQIIEPKSSHPEIAVISRDKAEQRFWLNEQEVVDAIGENAQKVYSEDLSFREQISIFNNATTIIAQHGAGLANSIFCKPGSRVIEVTSRSHARRAWDFGKLAIARGLEYHVVVIDAVLDDPFVNTQVPAERIPPCYASDLYASEEAIRFLVQLCGAE